MIAWQWADPEPMGSGWTEALTVRCSRGHRAMRVVRVPGHGLVLVNPKARVGDPETGKMRTATRVMLLDRHDEDKPEAILIRCACMGNADSEQQVTVADLYAALDAGRGSVLAGREGVGESRTAVARPVV